MDIGIHPNLLLEYRICEDSVFGTRFFVTAPDGAEYLLFEPEDL